MMARVDQQSVCDRELFSELTESPIARQSESDRELFSELTESPFAQQSVCDRELSSELTEPPIAEQTVCDRELFSELFETPIHPMLLNMVVSAWGKHLRKAYGDFGSISNPPQAAKRENS